mmetsp:Transcript_24999/g.54952  ORF Transcript_24999/g.54952 Transcript_24999/m.54952 type:complete len:563 (+) Transcript_24999:1262-2950(+)
MLGPSCAIFLCAIYARAQVFLDHESAPALLDRELMLSDENREPLFRCAGDSCCGEANGAIECWGGILGRGSETYPNAVVVFVRYLLVPFPVACCAGAYAWKDTKQIRAAVCVVLAVLFGLASLVFVLGASTGHVCDPKTVFEADIVSSFLLAVFINLALLPLQWTFASIVSTVAFVVYFLMFGGAVITGFVLGLSCWVHPGSGSPVSARVSLSSGWTVSQLYVGPSYACARSVTGVLWCWGEDGDGRLAQGWWKTHPFSRRPVPFPQHVLGAGLGAAHTCVVTTDSEVMCCGKQYSSWLGYGNVKGYCSVVRMEEEAEQISAGDSHTCALMKNKAVSCWGNNNEGQLCTGDTLGVGSDDQSIPVLAVKPVKRVSCGARHTCLLDDEGAVWCAGANGHHQAGHSGSGDGTLRKIADFEADYISAGRDHTCATSSGAVYCWGSNQFGQLGQKDSFGSSLGSTAPVVLDWVGKVEALSCGADHCCARSLTHGLKYFCWGRNQEGQLGTSDRDDRAQPETASEVQKEEPSQNLFVWFCGRVFRFVVRIFVKVFFGFLDSVFGSGRR